MKMKIIITVLMVLAFALSAYAADVVYVQSLKAKIMGEPSFGAEAVAKARKGEALTVLEKKGRWYKVGYMDKTGWVPALVVGPRPPMNRVSVFTGQEKSIQSEARRRASQVTSAAAARGLTDNDRRRLAHKSSVDYHSLEKIEAVAITEKELADFQGVLR